jgi:hypothetical protein
MEKLGMHLVHSFVEANDVHLCYYYRGPDGLI